MTRKEVFQIRLSGDERDRLDELSLEADMTPSQWLRRDLGDLPPELASKARPPQIDPRMALEWICECSTFNRNPQTSARCDTCGMQRPPL